MYKDVVGREGNGSKKNHTVKILKSHVIIFRRLRTGTGYDDETQSDRLFGPQRY